MKFAYYNEHDPKAAAWIRELIKDGLITDGEVDERSIEDVLPADLNGFTRCHFFAGIAVWDYALNQSGFTGRVWTGSCPCQPFSAAGKGEGFDDERHLWPAWFHLIEVCRPDTIFGEQVSSADGTTWLDLVHSDLEGIDYRIGTLDIPSASVGAPHRRQRFFWVADSAKERRQHEPPKFRINGAMDGSTGCWLGVGSDSDSRIVADTASGNTGTEREQRSGEQPGPGDARRESDSRRASGDLDDSAGSRRGGPWQGTESQARHEARMCGPECGCSACDLGDTIRSRPQGHAGDERDGHQPGRIGAFATGSITPAGFPDELGAPESDGRQQGRPQPSRIEGRPDAPLPGFTNGFWHEAEWIYCRDEKYRPTKPGIFPLADGVAGRVGLLRGAGNAIVPQAAEAFIRSYLEI